ncbi:MAG: NAD-dependent malic enzyme [Acidimicrobiales bacterium]|nr:MAG: NAD-dependent malic enzyme [Acidimicrobiales bacterium]
MVTPSGAVIASAAQRELTDTEVFGAHMRGKMSIASTVPMDTMDDLSRAYTPGVARVCTAIAHDPSAFASYTWAARAVAVVTDGTAVLGLGNIGPRAAMPVMEGKAILFKRFANIDAVPICLDTTDVDEIVDTVARLAPSFGGINLEDISAPRCFEVERKLSQRLDIPVFHDDQHGTAIVTLAALRNACLVTDRTLAALRVVIFGAGAAGVAIANILTDVGVSDVVLVDSRGVLHPSRLDLSPVKAELASRTNVSGIRGSIADALAGADALIGVSGGQIPTDAVAKMAPGGFIFAMANPNPEVAPEVAHQYAAVVATGRSDYPNQINNVLAFPGVFKGAFDAGAREITPAMKLAAASALADVAADVRSAERILPSALDPRVVPAVSAAVSAAA